MKRWYMLSLVGKDQAGLVARVSAGLCKSGCNLGDSSMARLGENFSIMVMVQYAGGPNALEKIVTPIAQSLNLKQHLFEIQGEGASHHIEPDVRISVFAEDRMGIVEDVTRVLAEAGLNILNLESSVDDNGGKSMYTIHIEGTTTEGIDPLYKALDGLKEKNIKSQIIPINAQVI